MLRMPLARKLGTCKGRVAMSKCNGGITAAVGTCDMWPPEGTVAQLDAISPSEIVSMEDVTALCWRFGERGAVGYCKVLSNLLIRCLFVPEDVGMLSSPGPHQSGVLFQVLRD